ncbi:MAG: hypothetical protein M1814_000781, partial [Vezdaea aestivalis]
MAISSKFIELLDPIDYPPHSAANVSLEDVLAASPSPDMTFYSSSRHSSLDSRASSSSSSAKDSRSSSNVTLDLADQPTTTASPASSNTSPLKRLRRFTVKGF